MSTVHHPQPLADERLLRRIAGGDDRAFEQLYDRHAPVAYSLARRMLRDERAAEDACQEAFLAIWRSAGRFDPSRGAPRGWLLQIVRNRAIDTIRARAVHARRLDTREDHLEHEPAPEQTEAQAQTRIDGDAIRTALHELPVEQRQVIVLAYYGGLTHTEIADLLKLPLGTVKGRMRLGLQKLQRPELAVSA